MPAGRYCTSGHSTNGNALPAKTHLERRPQSAIKQITYLTSELIESTVIAKWKPWKCSRLSLLYKSTAYFPHLSTLVRISRTPRWKWLLCFGRLWSVEHFVEAIKGPFPLPESLFKPFQMGFFLLFAGYFLCLLPDNELLILKLR